MAFDKTKIAKALAQVQDPGTGQDIITRNMVTNLEVEGTNINFTIELPSLNNEYKTQLNFACMEAIQKVYPEANVNIHLSAAGGGTAPQQPNPLPHVKNIIAVASGKGGVGKSTVSVNLALGLRATGAKVGLIDADIHGPSLPMMLGVGKKMPEVRDIKGKHYILPIEAQGVKVLSIGFLVDDRQAVVWRGPMVTSALRQFVTDVIWGKLDYLVIDMPPGTGDVHLTMVQSVQVTGAVVVTTPQAVSLIDAKKAMGMFTMPKINVPILGVVENMSYFSPDDAPEKKYYIFGKDGGRELADAYDVPFLGEIPLKQNIREGGDLGNPVFNQDDLSTVQAFEQIATRVAQEIAKNNAKPKPEIVADEN